MEKRYKTKVYNSFNHYLIECPKCKREASVYPGERYYDYDQAKIKCSECMYVVDFKSLILHKVTLKRNCPDCGEQISYERDGLKNAPKEVSVTCPKCSFTAEYTSNVTSYIVKPAYGKLKCDPIFGYPLWLQSEVRGNLFWGYNRDHLTAIEDYVECDLRERQGGYLMTMVARLPQFIKDAKNRDDILKTIKLLLEK